MGGRIDHDARGKMNIRGTMVSFHALFLPLFVLGMAGQHRRIYDYTNFPELAGSGMQDVRIFATLSLLSLLAFQAVFLFNFFYSMFKGEKAPNNPWNANTLPETGTEWVSSAVPAGW